MYKYNLYMALILGLYRGLVHPLIVIYYTYNNHDKYGARPTTNYIQVHNNPEYHTQTNQLSLVPE